MRGFIFSEYRPEENAKTPFERLLNLFMELLHYTNGDAAEALHWLTQLGLRHRYAVARASQWIRLIVRRGNPA